DFGTGFSSLSMLRKLPIDELKIDKSFIEHSTDNRLDKAMIINILNIARNLRLKVVAEGIEHQQQAKLLSDFDCDIQQGYFYSKPLKYTELEKYCSCYVSSPHDFTNA
ncbi:MAG: EAL domain-containing protein, partial [Gammaproteobacteria bacterium]|nr:EAL domain-containing protein [Gammaproteobacteria bacterium]